MDVPTKELNQLLPLFVLVFYETGRSPLPTLSHQIIEYYQIIILIYQMMIIMMLLF